MQGSAEWPDVEALIVERAAAEWAPLQAETVGLGTDTPAKLADAYFVRITASSGYDNGLTDRSTIDVEAFAPSRPGAHDIAESFRRYMLGLAGTARADGSGLVDTVKTHQRPRWASWHNPAVFRFVAAYGVAVRLQ